MLQRMPGGLQKQALLRINGGGVGRRDAEEQRIEAVDLVEEATPFRVGPAIGRPATLRYRTDRRAPFLQQPPEGVESTGPGEPPGHADDGDRLTRRLGTAVAGGDGLGHGLARCRRWGGLGRFGCDAEDGTHRVLTRCHEMVGEAGQRAVLEQQGLREGAKTGIEPVADLHRGQGFQPILLERIGGAHLGRIELQHVGKHATQMRQQGLAQTVIPDGRQRGDHRGLASRRGSGNRHRHVGHRRGDGKEHRLTAPARCGEIDALDRDEARIRQPPLPAGGVDHGRVGDPRCVGRFPPAFGQAEDQRAVVLRGDQLGHRQQPARTEQASQLHQHAGETRGGVQHVRGNHRVERADLLAVGLDALLDVVERGRNPPPVPAEGCLSMFQEAPGEVGIKIGFRCGAPIQLGENRAGRATGAGADLDRPPSRTARTAMRGDGGGGASVVRVG